MQVEQLHEQLSSQDFLALGLDHVAYIRPFVTEKGTPVFGVFAANGQRMGVVESADLAKAAIRQQDLEPVWMN
jgi:hypothetical protein